MSEASALGIATWQMAFGDQEKLVKDLEQKTRNALDQFKTQQAPGVDKVKQEYDGLVHALRVETKFLRALKKKIKRLSLTQAS